MNQNSPLYKAIQKYLQETSKKIVKEPEVGRAVMLLSGGTVICFSKIEKIENGFIKLKSGQSLCKDDFNQMEYGGWWVVPHNYELPLISRILLILIGKYNG